MRHIAMLLFCCVSFSAFAEGPSAAEIARVEQRAIEARAQALQTCKENPSGPTCTKYRQEFSKLVGSAKAMRQVAVGMEMNSESLKEQRALVELHSAAAAENCRSSQFFADCISSLDELDKANAFIATYGEYVPTESLSAEIEETRTAASGVVQDPGASTAPPALLCDPGAYGGNMCARVQQHLSSTAQQCDAESANSQCKLAKGDLKRIAEEMEIQAETQTAAETETPLAQNP